MSSQRMVIVVVLLATTIGYYVEGFVIQSSLTHVPPKLSYHRRTVPLQARDENEEEFLVKVPRRGRNRRRYFEEEEADDDYYRSKTTQVDDEWDYDDDEDEEGDYDWVADYDFEGGDKPGMFENVIIPNPQLDHMDPEGTIDRFPELAADPKFWFDMVVFFALMDWLSYLGPKQMFADMSDTFHQLS